MRAQRTGLDVPDTVARRLATEPEVWLATVRSDGTPHVTPVWFIFDQPSSTWWISTGAHSAKVRNMSARPAVSLALEDGRSPVVAEGTARIHAAPFPDQLVRAFADKYHGWDITVPDTPGDVRVLVEVPTRRWLFGRV